MLVHARIDFSKKVLDWDGFGFNYVETAQTPDYSADPQDYGGFSILDEASRKAIIELVFGRDGLKPNLVKMFLDPFHQQADTVNASRKIAQSNYDHTTATGYMRYFVKEGYRLAQAQGIPFAVITTLYGPPAFMTAQKILRGRDADPAMLEEIAKYMAAWVQYLQQQEKLPVQYLSIHNEGEDYSRWPQDGSHGNLGTGHDYNLYWSPEAAAEFLPLLRDVLDDNGLQDVGVTPGETSNWTRFYNWGYANAIANSPAAMQALGLITSHGFSGGLTAQQWHGDHRSAGADLLREQKPELHSWVTSTSWSNMDAEFVYQLHGNIYSAKNNAIIPWAGIQRPTKWVGGDPNPGNAIQVNEDGSYTIQKGYYYYKQVCPVAQKGMFVAQTSATNTATCALAFNGNGTGNPSAFVLVNAAAEAAQFALHIAGGGQSYRVYQTCEEHSCAGLADLPLTEGTASFTAPPNSVTTFVEK